MTKPDSPASTVDLPALRTWIGREHLDEDELSVRHARLMAATLGLAQHAFNAGTPLPPLWHWIYFLEALPPAELGRDGHPARGGFLPPVPLPNRMWAGGELEFHRPLHLGAKVRKRSTVRSIEHKRGRSGELVFVAVRHELLDGEHVAITETHDIVYKHPTPADARPADAPALPAATHTQVLEPTSTLLFRYSALTFNGHRIHYDADYCREVEGYEHLVVHGPLQATLLAGLARRLAGGPLRRFRYRGLRPALLGAPLTLNAAPAGDGFTLWTALADGSVSMLAQAGV
ncbi:FAS1-like dehydratase domain-containing protein [Azohydromonas lata]|uniref:MaoC family dehydratase N-terminal domain-containing protein n=1 Tax=Azohydromonas lata TaxID=45677 RepID=A0ABU5IQH3_9BURK|nr:MaoC family dehydratase N-terminal domain-containing protein [Azohydromonas lata]MDZ5461152.1 MaoC family dehydratase N-terminal domain-containing protein [Azohydromonas lata]